jgi:hypothetical protein
VSAYLHVSLNPYMYNVLCVSLCVCMYMCVSESVDSVSRDGPDTPILYIILYKLPKISEQVTLRNL